MSDDGLFGRHGELRTLARWEKFPPTIELEIDGTGLRMNYVPERTTRMLLKSPGIETFKPFVCERCGGIREGWVDENGGIHVSKFCPDCGARVVNRVE